MTARKVLSLITLLLAGTANAADLARIVKFDIPAQAVQSALFKFSEQTNVQVVVSSQVVANKQSQAVSGELPVQQGLAALLGGTGLEFAVINEQTVAIVEAESSDKGDSKLDEIVVTATKRAESIQNVPLSISVLSNEEIERKGIVGMSDYLRTLPGVSQIDLGAARNSIIIRGVSSDPQNDPSGQTVGYYLNDIPLTGYTFRGGADIKLVDLQRVEVIRGPQGTLYGSASLGGAVRNVPNPPDLDQLEGYAKAGYSYTDKAGSDNSSIEGVINVPIIAGKLAVRAVGYRFDNSGYVENIAGSDPATLTAAATFGVADLATDQKEVGSDEYAGARVSMLFQPIDNLKTTLTYLTQDISQEGLPEVELIRGGKFQQARLQLGELVGGGGEELSDDIDIHNALIEYQLAWGSLLSSSSWIREDFLEKRGIGSFFGGMPVPQRNPGNSKAFAQEVRFVSQFKGPAQVLVGLYYEDVDKQFRALNFYGGRDLSLNPFGQVLLTDQLIENNFKQKAAFGEASYDLTQELKLTLGARRFHYDRVDRTTDVDSAFAVAGVQTLQNENEGTTRKINLSFQRDSDSLLYTQWSEGFRLGKSVAPMSPLCDRDANGLIDGTNISSGARQLNPDTLDSYEIGAKKALLGGSLLVNGAVFRNSWTEVPISLTASCGFPALDNANEARTQGVELSSEYNVTGNLHVSAAAAYLEAELTRDSPGIGLEGDRLPGSPKFTLNFASQYEFAMRGLPVFVRADYAHVGGFYNNLQQAGVQAGDYDQLNLRVGLALRQLGIELFVNNVTNNDALTWVDSIFDGVDDRAFRLRPRTMGVNARFRF